MTPGELRDHKALFARMGMTYTEPYGPTDISEPKVQTRMREVASNAIEFPSIFNNLNDYDLGNQVRMLTRDDSGHEGVVCAARDRIFQLSLRVAELEGAVATAAGELEEAADKFWVVHCNHPGIQCGKGQAQDKAFLAVMWERSKGAAKIARGIILGAKSPANIVDAIAKALNRLLATTDPYRPESGTEAEVNARAEAVRVLNYLGFKTELQRSRADKA